MGKHIKVNDLIIKGSLLTFNPENIRPQFFLDFTDKDTANLLEDWNSLECANLCMTWVNGFEKILNVPLDYMCQCIKESLYSDDEDFFNEIKTLFIKNNYFVFLNDQKLCIYSHKSMYSNFNTLAILGLLNLVNIEDISA
jgi:hypothetical protein